MMLPTLPHELVERILLLTTESIQTCRLVNKALNEIIQSSLLLRYFQACEAAGVIDNPLSPLSYPERFEALKKREDAWRNLKPVFETTINVNQRLSFYGLTEGAYFIGDPNKKDLHYCQLPSSSQDRPQWNFVTGEGSPGDVVDFATAIYEHDLIVKATFHTELIREAQRWKPILDLVFLKFSTGEYHPLARQPRIQVQTSSIDKPRVNLGISGDNLVLVVHNYEYIGRGYYDSDYSDDEYYYSYPDRLIIFDWKTGHKRLEHKANNNSYVDFAFISPELLLVPNLSFSRFEVWHIPPNFKPPVQILCLQIPATNYSVVRITCGGEPKPFLNTMPYFPPRPLFTSPESSIIVTYIHFGSNLHVNGWGATSFALIMHRRALLDMIQKWTSTSLDQEYITEWFPNSVIVRNIADPDGGSVTKPSASSEWGTFDSKTMSECPGSSTYKFPQVEWASWGPPISRWLGLYDDDTKWLGSFHGQRWAFYEPHPIYRKRLRIKVVDFNPHNLRRHREMMKRLGREGKYDSWKDPYIGKEETSEKLYDGGAFLEEVYMGLKCVVYCLPGAYDFDEVLMDGERLLGIKFNFARTHVNSIKVLYFG